MGGLFHPKATLISMWKTLCDAHPANASYVSIGKSYNGLDIWMFRIGNPNGGCVLWDGSMHGWEDIGSEVEYLIAQWLLSGDVKANELLQTNYSLFVPIVNMDSTERGNANFAACKSPYGVDLNRNFVTGWSLITSCGDVNNGSYGATHGLSAASESETQALRNVFQTYRPAIYVNTHYGGGPYLQSCGTNTTLTNWIKNRILQLSNNFPWTLNSGGGGGNGLAVGDANSFGANSWLWEIASPTQPYASGSGDTYSHTAQTLADVQNYYYPQMRPAFIAICEAVAIAANPIVVTVNLNKVEMQNKLRLGVQIGHDNIRGFGLDNGTRWQKWAKDFKCKLIRFFEYQTDFNWNPDTDKYESGPHHPCRNWDETTQTGTFDWRTVNRTIGAIFSIGAEPLVVLGMYLPLDLVTNNSRRYFPQGMTIDTNTGMPLPNSFANYCKAWVQHFKDVGLPVRYYEIINEPNVFTETRLISYMSILDATIPAMKNLNPNLQISFDRICVWGNSIEPYWLANGGVDLDSINYHQYNCGVSIGNTGYYDDPTVFSRSEDDNIWHSNAILAQKAQIAWQTARGKLLPILNTECNLNSAYDPATDPRQEVMTGAVWLAITLRQEILHGVDYHIYFVLGGSYGYEYLTKAHGLGFGFMETDYGKPYVPYHVYWYLGNNLVVGDTIYESITNDANIRTLAWKNGNKLNIMLVNMTPTTQKNVQLLGVSGIFNYFAVDETIPSPIGQPSVDRAPITGTIDVTAPLILNGYTVAFLQQALPTNNIVPLVIASAILLALLA